MPTYLTVVYAIQDEAAFAPERKKMLSLFGAPSSQPFAITAMSTSHEIRRLELMEEAAEARLDDLAGVIDAIASRPDIAPTQTLQDVIGRSS